MVEPVGPYPPTNGLVVMAWLGSRAPGISAGQVGGALPDDRTKWVDQGFIQVTEIPGARADIDLPQARKPIVQLDFWACAIGSARPPWNKAARLAELVRSAVEVQLYGKPVTMPPNYLGARVQSVYLLDEPSVVRNDPNGYARLTADLAVDWVRA